MTAPLQLINSSGQSVPLGRQLASGGEGAVYLLPNAPDHLAKVYHDHRPPSQQTVEKLVAMVKLKNDKLLSVAAWPTELLFTSSSWQVAGFIMPYVQNADFVYHLYNPLLRPKYFPRSGWAFQVCVAWNAAAAFEEVHANGFVIGDVNQKNLLVLPDARVRVLDGDSFQIRSRGRLYRCEVGVPEFTPPELQSERFDAVEQTANHDLFRLAVLIYSLLFVGRHPYSGVYTGSGDPELKQLIREYRFTQGPLARNWDRAPPPHTPTFADIPPDLGMLFRRAFEPGSQNNTRPRPGEWMAVLKELERNTAVCPDDPGHQHWKGQSRCVWCRLANGGGPEYYFGAGGQAAGFAVDEKKLQDVLRRLAEAVESPPAPTRATYRRGVAVAGRSLTEQAMRLKAAWESATTAANGIITARRAEEVREIWLAEANEARLLAEVDEEFDDAEREWEEEYDEARAVVAEEWKDRRRITIILASVAVLGCVGVCAGLFLHHVVAITGGIAAAVFGVWLLIHLALLNFGASSQHLAEVRKKWKRLKRMFADRREELRYHTADFRRAARAETDKVIQSQEARVASAERTYLNHVAVEWRERERRLQECERVVADLERALGKRADGTIGQHRRARAELVALVNRCRGLAAEYQMELRRVVANAEAVARTRHLRMNLITDAEITGIGAGRKQKLLANGIATAADVTWNAVRGINGFGETYTQRLVDWRSRVERAFSFNQNAVTNSSEHRAIVQQFRTRQSQYHSEMTQLLGELGAQQPLDLSAQHSALRLAVAEWEQAQADLQVMTRRS